MLTTWQTELLPVHYIRNGDIFVNLTSYADMIEYNNTFVWCISMYPGYFAQVYFSNVGKILIQGVPNGLINIVVIPFLKVCLTQLS